ncbi:hypothetical protein BUALT_Bualt05G0077800 [Buddleja alternifolia]|uniref:Expansin-like B1 n=1 Tax=Buddleja alternifolia TaxID=168488 RepID=A0AAV6XIZ5_9LAMI|nr:hypothetical protein BUALT_Bualt05G0077800 [Buddleja alternifolia]
MLINYQKKHVVLLSNLSDIYTYIFIYMASSTVDHYCYFFFTKFIVVILVLAASVCYGEEGYIYSRATYYGSPECLGNPNGACGYGEYGTTVNNGEVSGVSRLFRNGTGCGACYQVRCKIPTHCSKEGTKVVVTDFGVGPHTDFILSVRAYANLALPNMAAELYAYGVVDVEYQRIPCQYGKNNLFIKVHERSKFPHYLAILPVYQSGLSDIVAVQLWQEDCKEWRAMRKVFGAVWDMENPPIGAAAVNLRIQLCGGDGQLRWVQIADAIPSDWKAGLAYDTAFQLN